MVTNGNQVLEVLYRHQIPIDGIENLNRVRSLSR